MCRRSTRMCVGCAAAMMGSCSCAMAAPPPSTWPASASAAHHRATGSVPSAGTAEPWSAFCVTGSVRSAAIAEFIYSYVRVYVIEGFFAVLKTGLSPVTADF